MHAPIERLLVMLALLASCGSVPKASNPPVLESETVAERAKLGTVKISHMRGLGSGFAVADNLVITAAHVIAGAPPGMIITTSEGQRCELEQAALFPDKDVAFMWVRGCDLHPLELSTEAPAAGQDVWASGHPMGLEWTVSRGIVSHPDRHGRIQIDAALNPGMSGGPVLDEHGHVVGMGVSLMTHDGMFDGIAYAVDSETMVELLARFWAKSVVSQASGL